MPEVSQISPYTASCGGGLILNKDVYNMQPGEALQLTNFEPSIEGGYNWSSCSIYIRYKLY
jgi:hypothetical protein